MNLEFIMVPIVVGLCVAGTYGLFELFARRKERLAIIEKIGDKLDASALGEKIKFSSPFPRISFSALKVGCLLTGTGLGLLVGFWITTMVASYGVYRDDWNWFRHEVTGTVYGASVLLFGGLGLIIAFIIELKLAKKKAAEQ